MINSVSITWQQGQAIKSIPQTDEHVRCHNPQCRKLLADRVSRPYRFTCPRCKAQTESPP